MAKLTNFVTLQRSYNKMVKNNKGRNTYYTNILYWIIAIV